MAAPVAPSKTSSLVKYTAIASVMQVLRLNNTFIDNDVAYVNYPGIEAVVDTLVRADRGSGSEMQPESRNMIGKTRKEFATANELTFVIELWKLLVHDNRNVKTMGATDKVAWIKQAWKMDGLRLNWQADFVRTALPTLMVPNPEYAKLLESLQVPRPDRTYGHRVTELI